MRAAWMIVAVATVGCGKLADEPSDASAETAPPATDAGPDVDPTAPPLGTIVVQEVQQWTQNGTKYLPEALAKFAPPSTQVAGAQCISTAPQTQCGYPPTCLFGGPTLLAGTVTVAGWKLGSGLELTLGDGGDVPYEGQGTWSFEGFAGGDVLTATASGDQAPAFTAQVTVPANITILEPPLLASQVPSGQDFTLTWSGGESGAWVSVVFDPPPNGPPIQATCTFDATAGTGTIPHDSLGGFTGTTYAEVMLIRDAKTWVGDYPIDFQIERTTTLQIEFQ